VAREFTDVLVAAALLAPDEVKPDSRAPAIIPIPMPIPYATRFPHTGAIITNNLETQLLPIRRLCQDSVARIPFTGTAGARMDSKAPAFRLPPARCYRLAAVAGCRNAGFGDRGRMHAIRTKRWHGLT